MGGARNRQHNSTRLFEGEDHLRRDDAPSQLSARRLEDGVGVGLVQPEGHWDAPVQQLEHLALDACKQGHIDVEDVVQDVAELCRGRARWLHEVECQGLGVWAVQVEGRERWGRGRGGGQWDLPQAEVAFPRRFARDDTCAQQHWADRACPQRRWVQEQHMLNASVGHHQLPDGHSEALGEERHVLVHLCLQREA